jgi:hypothetical protein
MNYKTVHLLDLPDEILLIIMKKLGSMNVLYSLLGVNQRLDQMARTINYAKSLDFSTKLSYSRLRSINYVNTRFCHEILPQIHHNIISLTFDRLISMTCVLLAGKYPNLSTIVFYRRAFQVIY